MEGADVLVENDVVVLDSVRDWLLLVRVHHGSHSIDGEEGHSAQGGKKVI